jgi:hypothetical protein
MQLRDEQQTGEEQGAVPTRWDVVVFRTVDAYERETFLWTDPPIIHRLDIGHDVFIERLAAAVARRLGVQCSAGGVDSQVAQRYSFVRVFPRGTDPRDFDEDQRLQIAIALSRLIRPTSVALEESAQVSGPMNDASVLVVTPGPITGPASAAYVADRERADWLTPTDGAALRQLLDAFLARGASDRVMRGLWHHENAARSLDMAARWTSVVTGLEALFNTDAEWVTRQFKHRCARVAAELRLALTVKQADSAYRLRSHLAHGAVTRVDPATLELYVAVERVLRQTLRRGIEADDWRNRLADDASVRHAWPIEIPTECPTCRQPLPQHDGPECSRWTRTITSSERSNSASETKKPSS